MDQNTGRFNNEFKKEEAIKQDKTKNKMTNISVRKKEKDNSNNNKQTKQKQKQDRQSNQQGKGYLYIIDTNKEKSHKSICRSTSFADLVQDKSSHIKK